MHVNVCIRFMLWLRLCAAAYQRLNEIILMKSTLIVLFLFKMGFIEGQREPNRSVTPNDPVFLVGDPLKLKCSLKGKLNGFNSSDLVFKLRFYRNSSDVIIPSKFVHQMSRRRAQLVYVELKQEHHLAKVFCGLRILKDDEYAIITVGHAPYRPQITQWWLYNWEELIFEWEIPNCDNGFETIYTAWYKNRDSDEFSICNRVTSTYCLPPKSSSWCRSVPSRFSCSIPDAMHKFRPHGGYALLNVTASNKEGEMSKMITTVVITLRVQPGPVQDLAASCSNGSHVVTFLSPKRMEHMCFHIHVECTGDRFEEDYFYDDNETYMDGRERIFEFKGLPYYTVCSVSVRGIPLEDKCDMNASKNHCWSAWVITSFVTNQYVPLDSPETVFEIKTVGESCSRYRNIIIYYKRLTKLEARGVVYCYRLRNSVTNGSRYFSSSYVDSEYRMCMDTEDNCPTQSANEISQIYTYNDSQRLNENCSIDGNSTSTDPKGQSNRDGFYVEFLALINEEYNLTLDARTGPGYNDSLPLKPIIISNQTEVHPGSSNFTVISISCTETRLSWNPPKENEKVVNFYTVIWCPGFMNSMKCNRQPEWRVLNPSEFVYIVYASAHDHIFGIGMSASNGQSIQIIQWASYVYDYSADAPPPEIFESSVTSSKITLTLMKPIGSKGGKKRMGYVHGFAVYCYLCQDTNCTGNLKMIGTHHLGESNPKLNLTDLLSSATYKFIAESLTSTGRSSKNNSKIVRTEEFTGMTEKQRNGIIAGSVFGGMLVLFGLFTIIKYNKKMITKLVQWWKVEPTVEVMQSLNMKFSADDDVLKDDYFGYVKDEYFDNSPTVNDVFDEGEPILPPANESSKTIAREQDNELSILHRLQESESQLSRPSSGIAPMENNDIHSSLEWLASDPHWLNSGEYCITVQQKELKSDEEDEYSNSDPIDQYLSHKVREPTQASDVIESDNSSLNLQLDSIEEDVFTRRCTQIGTVYGNDEQISDSVDNILSISLRSINSFGGRMLADDTLYDTDTDSSGYIGGKDNKQGTMSIDCDNLSLLAGSGVEENCHNNNDECNDDNRFDSGIPSSLTSLQDELSTPVQAETDKESICDVSQDLSCNDITCDDLQAGVVEEYSRTGYHAVRVCDVRDPDICQ